MSVTLDSIRAAAEAKYGSYPIDLGDAGTLRLQNPLRLPKHRRDELAAIQGELDVDKDDAAAVAAIDQADIFSRMIRTVADNQGLADVMLSQIGDDLAVLAEIVSEYSKGTQVGEASASAA